jgi:large subunit ribosomal protein L14
MCIQILGASNRLYAHIGDVIIVVVKKTIPNMSLTKSGVIRAIIICIYKELKLKNGMSVHLDNNVVIVINQEGNARGTCVFDPIAQEL